jgi:hypothetical protein
MRLPSELVSLTGSEKNLSQLIRKVFLIQKIVAKLSENLFRFADPGVKKAQDP